MRTWQKNKIDSTTTAEAASINQSDHGNIYVMAETQQPATIEELVEELLDCARYGEEDEVKAILKDHPEIGSSISET